MQRLHNDLQIECHVLGIISSRSMFLYSQKACDLETWQTDLAMSVRLSRLHITASSCVSARLTCSSHMQGEPPSLEKFTEFFKGFKQCHKVIVDCTADAQVPLYYGKWLSSGIHVVTPNKKLCSGPMADWTAVREATQTSGSQFMYEASMTTPDFAVNSCQHTYQPF